MAIVTGYSESTIPAGMIIRGRIEGAEQLTVAGTVDGEIELRGTLRVLEGGYLRGRMTVWNASISGRVEGTLIASEKAEIFSTARIDGEIRAGRLTIAEGALVNGTLVIGPVDTPAHVPMRELPENVVREDETLQRR